MSRGFENIFRVSSSIIYESSKPTKTPIVCQKDNATVAPGSMICTESAAQHPPPGPPHPRPGAPLLLRRLWPVEGYRPAPRSCLPWPGSRPRALPRPPRSYPPPPRPSSKIMCIKNHRASKNERVTPGPHEIWDQRGRTFLSPRPLSCVWFCLQCDAPA